MPQPLARGVIFFVLDDTLAPLLELACMPVALDPAGLGAPQRFAFGMDRPSGQQRLGIVPVNHKLLFHHSSSFVHRGSKHPPMKTRRLALAAISGLLALPASAQTLPGGVLPGPLFPAPGSGSLYPSNGSLFPNSSMPQQHGNFGGGRH